MPDLCDLILDDHEALRRFFAQLDQHRDDGPETLSALWGPLAALLDVHAAAEEEVFYPRLLAKGDDARDETSDAIGDHNKIRDAVAAAGRATVDSAEWWEAVGRAREQNSDHMAEEERGALADFRTNTSSEARDRLGGQFSAFKEHHAGGHELRVTDKNPQAYIAKNSPGAGEP